MKYFIQRKKIMGKVIEFDKSSSFDVVFRNGFNVGGAVIKTITVMNKKLAYPFSQKIVMKKYSLLIPMLTDLVISDDETGDSFREALNQIEKFRQEIKNKYRDFLLKKELELMAKQLSALKLEAEKRLMEIENSYMESKSNGKGK